MASTSVFCGRMPDGTAIFGTCPETPAPERRPLAQRMADTLIEAYDARGNATRDDLARAGFTADEVDEHGRRATGILRRRLNGRRQIVGA
ncbi:hypothetical protein [Zavarzinia sp.]|uniref:hypothetical protein n=1 Tax=Zavarzinia sp. TaxID=2027920 RepID=UPI003BB6E4EF